MGAVNKLFLTISNLVLMVFGFTMSNIQTKKIIKAEKRINWISIIVGVFIILFSFGMSIWQTEKVLRYMKK